MNNPKILLFDIENSPSSAYIWRLFDEVTSNEMILDHWYLLCWAAKWLGEEKIYSSALIDFPKDYKKSPENDKKVLKKLWKLLDEADIVIGHNCVEINTPVLMQDLTWKKAKDIQIGDKVVGFEEKNKPGIPCRTSNKWNGKGNRKILPSIVNDFKIVEQECYEVELSNGDKIITTKDHYWLAKAKKDENLRWYKTEDLKIKYHRISKYFNVWESDKSYEAGWLSGFISGEGTLKQRCGFYIDFCQRPGITWKQALDFCKKLNINLQLCRKPKTGGLGKQDTLYTGINGGKFAIAEILGKLQIKRFIDKLNWNLFGGLSGQNKEIVYITKIKNVGKQKVAVISTSTNTFFGNGYAMHNCKNFDVRKSNARFIMNGMTPPRPYKVIDTLEAAKRYFFFTSNKLDNLGKYLKVGQKVETGGFNLWKKCMAGDKKAWKLMVTYCKNDVLLLEKIYLKLRPYITNHPNISVFVEGEELICPKCGSIHIKKEGFSYTTIGKYQQYSCKDCGAWSRGRKNLRETKVQITN